MHPLLEQRPSASPSPPALELHQLAGRLQPVFLKLGVRKVIAFGSIARGTQTRGNDLDLIVVRDTERRFIERSEDLIGPVSLAVPTRTVEILVYTPTELDAMKNRPVVLRALRESRVIYEPGVVAA